MLCFDETVTFPAFSMMMRDERGIWFIGGGDDKSRLEVGVHLPSDLPKQDLAQTIVCYVVQLGCGFLVLACCNHYNINAPTTVKIRKRCDTNRNPYVVYLKPRRLTGVSAQ